MSQWLESHPSRDIVGLEGNELDNLRIALCICGSVACVRSPDIARLMMRHGAEVIPIMTDAATELIHPNLMHWATGVKPVTRLTGAIEHVAAAGNVERPADIVLVAPATANTIGKIACGIDDTPVTTTVTTAIGQGIPVIVVPAMHAPMYDHPIVRENIERLSQTGIRIVMPTVEEGKAKIADSDDILAEVIHTHRDRSTRKGPLAGRRVLITTGRTVEYLDPIRCITNNSSGKMGMAIARAAVRAGADVSVVYGKGTAEIPTGTIVTHVETAAEMREAVYEQLQSTPVDICVAAAAVGDWMPKQRAEKKITTHGATTLTLELVPTPKIIDGIKETSPQTLLVAFRALSGLTDEELIENAYNRLQIANADLIAVNDTSRPGAGFETDTNELFVIDRERKVKHLPLMSKDDAAGGLIEVIAEHMGRNA